MQKLQNISTGYMDLFKKTGKIEFFILSKECLKLKNDIEFTVEEKFSTENELGLF